MNNGDKRNPAVIVEELISRRGRGAEHLIPHLLDMQALIGWLPEEYLRSLCAATSISPSDLAGVISFFPRFRLRPAGRHRVLVCVGTACHVSGALDTWAEFLHQLKIPEGEDTDRDRLFTVEQVSCLGCCMLAPAVRIGEHTYGHVDASRVPDVLSDFLESLGEVREVSGQIPPAPGEVAGEVRICLCTSCRSAGSEEVYRESMAQAAALTLPAAVRSVGCTGISSEAPVVDVVLETGKSWRYGRISPDEVRPLLLEHFRPRRIAARLQARVSRFLDGILTSEGSDPVIRYLLGDAARGGYGLNGEQVRFATLHAGEIDPLDLDAWERRGAFGAFRRVTEELSPEEVIALIDASGLRGRGGAGYPTGSKWAEVRNAPGKEKYVICNGDEGDPGAFMDRMILESFPFRVIEGMAVAAAVTGATRGYIYVRGEYALAISRLRDALALFRARGFLGNPAKVSESSFSLEVFEGAGAYVCGEETALIESMEGRRGMPRARPPYPSEEGLRGCPTLVNNVETFALIPSVIGEGHEAFASLGTASSRGTKTFALAGRISHGGLIEVPMGITLKEIVEKVGGGVPGGRTLKAIQVGGPSGGCVPASLAHTGVDFEALQAAGAIMGSGGMVVLDERDCMVDMARYFTLFASRESCGKCGVCRVGTARMLEILEEICAGRGKEGHLAKLEEVGRHLCTASLCGLGRTAPNTVLSTLRYFPEEYRSHLDGRCPAGRCKELIGYHITEQCIGCTRCAQRCPAEAIALDPYRMHSVREEKCTRCDLCRQVCPVDAVEVV